MLKFMGLKKPHNSESDLSTHQVFLTLQDAMSSRELVEVSIKGDSATYQSLILEVDSDEKTLLIDELFPGTHQGVPGQTIEIKIRQRGGRSIKFNSVIREKYTYDDAPIYVIGMPEDLDQDQRRGAFRLPIEPGLLIESHGYGPEDYPLNAFVRNLSSSGICLETDDETVLQYGYGDTLSDVTFEFAGVHVECDVAVRNVLEDGNIHHPIRIGAEFLDIPPIEHRQLETAILQVQRERLRKGDMQRALLTH